MRRIDSVPLFGGTEFTNIFPEDWALPCEYLKNGWCNFEGIYIPSYPYRFASSKLLTVIVNPATMLRETSETRRAQRHGMTGGFPSQ